MIGEGLLGVKGNSVLSILGSNPLNSATTWVTKSFVSLLRGKPSNAFTESRGTRGYVSTRGFLISKDRLLSLDDDTALWESGYMFQFNPSQIQDIKASNFEVRSYAGLPYVDYIWTGGGERIINFQLFLDDTPQSHTRTFRPQTFGSKLASELKTTSKGKSKLLSKQGITDLATNVASQVGISLTKAPKKLEWNDSTGAYSHTRIHERGTLEAVERITQFLYPALQGKHGNTDLTPPKFSTGGIVQVEQFRPPSIVVFSFGDNYYLEGIIKSANTTHTLFDSDLTPIRSTLDIEFGVIDTAPINDRKSFNYPQDTNI